MSQVRPIVLVTCLMLAAACSSSSLAPAPRADVLSDAPGTTPPVDRSGKGAVLCSWSLYVAAKRVGETCFPGESPELQHELERSIARIEAFIVQNSSRRPTLADLQAFKAMQAANTRKELQPDVLCRGDAATLYRALRDAGVEGLKTQTDDLLPIPREPVINPCI